VRWGSDGDAASHFTCIEHLKSLDALVSERGSNHDLRWPCLRLWNVRAQEMADTFREARLLGGLENDVSGTIGMRHRQDQSKTII